MAGRDSLSRMEQSIVNQERLATQIEVLSERFGKLEEKFDASFARFLSSQERLQTRLDNLADSLQETKSAIDKLEVRTNGISSEVYQSKGARWFAVKSVTWLIAIVGATVAVFTFIANMVK